MSLPVATTISGIDSMRVLKQNVRDRVADSSRSARRADGTAAPRRGADLASDGRFELYKTTAEHDGDEGRQQHGFPLMAELAG